MATTFLFNAAARTDAQQRLYLDESGTLGYSGELFTMAFVLVDDLPKLEACTLKHRVTQSEVKASQMKTAQKLALARTLLEENSIQVFLAKLDPLAAMVCERKLDKEFLYDSMVAQALACYLERGDLPQGLPYRISMDMRGGLRESYEDMVGESVGNVLMHREAPLVTGLDVRFLDSRYSAGVQAADLFSNIYRTALTQHDSPCLSFLRKYEDDGRVHAGFTFGLPELADQMTQIASDLRARVELEDAQAAERAEAERLGVAEGTGLAGDVEASEGGAGGLSRSARRRRSRRAAREREAAQATEAIEREREAESTAPVEESASAGKTVHEQAASIAAPAEPPIERRAKRRPGDRAGAEGTPAQSAEPTAEQGATPAEDAPERARRARTRSRRGGQMQRTEEAAVPAEAKPAATAPADGAPAAAPRDSAQPATPAVQATAADTAPKAPAARLPFAPVRDIRPGRAGRLRQTLAAQKRAAALAPSAQQEPDSQPAPLSPAPTAPAAEAQSNASAAPQSEGAPAPKPRRSRRTKTNTTPETAAQPAPAEQVADQAFGQAPATPQVREAEHAEPESTVPAPLPASADKAPEPAAAPTKKRSRTASSTRKKASSRAKQPETADATPSDSHAGADRTAEAAGPAAPSAAAADASPTAPVEPAAQPEDAPAPKPRRSRSRAKAAPTAE